MLVKIFINLLFTLSYMNKKQNKITMASFNSNIWKMYVFKFLTNLHFFGGVLVPFFLDWGGISFTQLMILQSFFVICIFLLEIPTGAIADYVSRKASIILSALATALAILIYTSHPNFYIFLIGEFFWALGFTLLSGADEALIYDSLKRTKQENTSKSVFGRYHGFELMGLMVAAPIGSFIAAKFGLRIPMLIVIIPLMIAFLFAFTLKEPKTRKKVESKRYLSMLVSGVKYFKNNNTLQILAFDRISIGVLAFFLVWTYQPLLKLLSVPLFYFGFIHAGFTGIQVIFMNRFEWLENRFGSKKRYLLWSAIISGAAFILLGLNSYVPITIALIIIIGGFGLSRYVLFNSYMNKYIESHNRATVISTISMVDRFVRALLYPLIGLLVEWSLRYSLVIIGIAIVIFALVSKVEEKHLVD